ncbi:MAG: hypothetical protein HKP56_17800 [Anderseniella sp.]|nr:hypothetical protein [Anderseniella sp.]
MSHADKLSDTAARAAEEAASTITDKARDTVDLVEKTASEAIDDQRNSASRYVTDLGTAAFSAAHSLSNSGHTRSSEYASVAARALDEAGYQLSSYDVGNLVDDAADVVRRNPGLSAAIAALAGYSLVKLASSSRKREY